MSLFPILGHQCPRDNSVVDIATAHADRRQRDGSNGRSLSLAIPRTRSRWHDGYPARRESSNNPGQRVGLRGHLGGGLKSTAAVGQSSATRACRRGSRRPRRYSHSNGCGPPVRRGFVVIRSLRAMLSGERRAFDDRHGASWHLSPKRGPGVVEQDARALVEAASGRYCRETVRHEAPRRASPTACRRK